ncbi:MAG: sugar ABC transporter permease [Provencibacterium sp.]|nr:sugar ABC transporter permease [Provencibacterium sp.]
MPSVAAKGRTGSEARKPNTRSKSYQLKMRLKRTWPLYVFLLLPLIYLAVVQYYPMYGAQIAFKDFKAGLGIAGSPWVGLKHFKRFFNDYQFWRILPNTLILSFYSLLATFPMTILLSLMMNTVRSNGYRKAVQMITYMPHFISTVVMVGILVQFLNPRIGMLAQFLQMLGGTDRDLMGLPQAFPHLYVWSGIWQNVGWGTIIYLAALASVDPSQHEAALIDGANRLQRMLYVDLPAILPTAIIMLILDAGRIMNIGFEKVFLMQNDLNLSASEVISTYVYKMGIGGTGRSDFSYGAAIGLFNSAVNFILVVTVNQISKAMKQNSLW